MLPYDNPKARRTVEYFVPDHLLLAVEHRPELSTDAIAERLQAYLVQADRRLINATVNPGRVVTFERQKINSEQPGQQAFSLAFADVPVPNNRTLLSIIAGLDRRIGRDDDEGFAIRAVTPNWIMSGADATHIGVGGPGARPVPFERPGPVPYQFQVMSTLPARRETHLQPVEVALLDTAPSRCALEKAYAYWRADHPLIRAMLGPNGKYELPNKTLEILYAPHLIDLLNHPANSWGIKGHEYDMADHGLFAAGIVHTLAPGARLLLVQVLNDYGVGTVETIAAGLRQVADRQSEIPLIVNLSLTLAMPLDERHRRSRRELVWKAYAERPNFVDRMALPLEWICDELSARNAAIVAAAGNDARGGSRPKARYPAGFGSVTGVGALQKEADHFSPAAYSNLSDTPPEDGIITFGGNIMSDGKTDPDNGMLGVYTGRFPNGQPCRNGWARWAGTSFSAPVVSGVLAQRCIQGESPLSAVRTVMRSEFEGGPLPQEQRLHVEQG